MTIYTDRQPQIYNSTVTQMSACLLSLSVISLVLPVSLAYLILSQAPVSSFANNC